MKILIVSLASILILKTDAVLAFESIDQLTQSIQKQDFMLPGVCEFNPDLPFCKKNPICKYEMQKCETEEILICKNMSPGENELVCKY